MYKKYLQKTKQERGAVEVVEAAFVFPIVIFVVILLIMFGNLLYQQAVMDSVAVQAAEYMASLYTNPLLAEDSLPTNSSSVTVKPYRYILGDSEAETATKKYINEQVNKTTSGLFSGMGITVTSTTCKIKNYLFYQTAQVQIEYTINFLPMKLFGLSSLVKCSNATVTAAVDPAEFIRNVDMVMDYIETTGLDEKVNKLTDSLSQFLKD